MQPDHAYHDRQRFLRAEQHPTRLTPLAIGLLAGLMLGSLHLAARWLA